MNATLRKRLLKWTSVIALGILFVADAKPARAMPCFTDLSHCYFRAAIVDGIWMRFAAGMDCELSFASCLRQDLAGW